MSAAYLFSVDLEDVDAQKPRLVETTCLYLDFLRRHDATATFFVVGEVARTHPDLIRRVAGEGHEIACHSDRHVPLDRQDPAVFRDDLSHNLEALRAVGVERVSGYRAPCFSLTERTRWAYVVLAELGFAYSSSVLPARNPLYGWPGFGAMPKRIEGIIELPMTLLPWRLLPVPMGGGVYFRVLPWPLLRRALRKRLRASDDVLGYFHPYDVDAGQPRAAFPGFSKWSLYSLLLNANRGAVLPRLEQVARLGFAIRTYESYAEALCLEDREPLHAG